MNKRLVEIHNQTMYWVADNGGLRISDRIPTGYTEKFAELIVKECYVALSPMLRDMISRGQAYDLIKQHFGVEE